MGNLCLLFSVLIVWIFLQKLLLGISLSDWYRRVKISTLSLLSSSRTVFLWDLWRLDIDWQSKIDISLPLGLKSNQIPQITNSRSSQRSPCLHIKHFKTNVLLSHKLKSDPLNSLVHGNHHAHLHSRWTLYHLTSRCATSLPFLASIHVYSRLLSSNNNIFSLLYESSRNGFACWPWSCLFT